MNAKIAFVAVSVAALAVGCGNRSSSNSKALDIVDPYAPSSYAAAQPTPQPAAPQPVAQPVVYDTQPAPAAGQFASAAPTPTGGNYQVKRGDTLFSIAKSRYGNGNQWQKIASANPGLTPQNLKAGQTITIP